MSRFVPICLAGLILSACTQESAQSVVEQPTVVQREAGESVEALMTNIVMPNVDKLWTAVSYVSTAEGTFETQPETDEDWEALRASANALLNAAAALDDTNRPVGELDRSTTAYQYTPDEIAELLAEDAGPWRGYLENMRESTRLTLQAIELRDIGGLQDFGARINQACEGCHADYWYRPQGMMVPR